MVFQQDSLFPWRTVSRNVAYGLELQKREDQAAALQAQKTHIGFGAQIRSYVLAPYRLVKDHRTKLGIGKGGFTQEALAEYDHYQFWWIPLTNKAKARAILHCLA